MQKQEQKEKLVVFYKINRANSLYEDGTNCVHYNKDVAKT